jgi:hypothetical protein
MEKATKKTIIVVGSTMVISMLADVVMYSIGASKTAGKFSLHMPKGKELGQVIVIGVVMGFVIDAITNKLVESQKSEQEKALDKLVKADVAKLDKGELKTAGPIKILWA